MHGIGSITPRSSSICCYARGTQLTLKKTLSSLVRHIPSLNRSRHIKTLGLAPTRQTSVGPPKLTISSACTIPSKTRLWKTIPPVVTLSKSDNTTTNSSRDIRRHAEREDVNVSSRQAKISTATSATSIPTRQFTLPSDRRARVSTSVQGLMSCLALFSFVSHDVMGGDTSAHLLQHIDQMTHAAVNEHVSEHFRRMWASRIISNVPWIITMTTLVLTTVFVGLQRQKKGVLTAISVLAVILYVACGGYNVDSKHVKSVPVALFSKRSNLISIVKKNFHRERPSNTIESSYAFPSGHTFVATGSAGILSLVVMPCVYSKTLDISSGTRIENVDDYDDDDDDKGVMNYSAFFIIFIASAVTASGRVLADVHWVSDTIAGISLGLAATNSAILIEEMLMQLVLVVSMHRGKGDITSG